MSNNSYVHGYTERESQRLTAPDGVFCYTFFKGVAIG